MLDEWEWRVRPFDPIKYLQMATLIELTPKSINQSRSVRLFTNFNVASECNGQLVPLTALHVARRDGNYRFRVDMWHFLFATFIIKALRALQAQRGLVEWTRRDVAEMSPLHLVAWPTGGGKLVGL